MQCIIIRPHRNTTYTLMPPIMTDWVQCMVCQTVTVMSLKGNAKYPGKYNSIHRWRYVFLAATLVGGENRDVRLSVYRSVTAKNIFLQWWILLYIFCIFCSSNTVTEAFLALCNKAGHYIFALWFLSFLLLPSSFFPRVISAVGD